MSSDRRRDDGSRAPAASESPALEIRGLRKRFGSLTVVDDVSLTLGVGESIVLLGPSGCGKTTTLRMIAGLEEPDRGEIRLFGRPITNVLPHRREIGFVFQDFALFPHLSVYENLAFGLKLRNLARSEIDDRVKSALELVRMPAERFASRRPGQLSGGQRQRVAIARTLVTNPRVVLLDEPLAALDRQLRDHMLLEMKELQNRTRIPAVYVTHDQEAAMILADRVVVMNGGRIEQIGTPTEIYRNPASLFVATFLGEMNVIPMVVASRTSQGAVLRGDSLELHVSNTTFGAGARVIAGIRPPDLGIATEAVPNGIPVTVIANYFAGSSSVVQLRSEAGLEMTARTPDALASARPGERVFAHVRPSSIVVLAAGDEAKSNT